MDYKDSDSWDLYGKYSKLSKNKKKRPTRLKSTLNGKLIFAYCNKIEVIEENKPFALLKYRKKQLEKEIQYQKGKLIITY